MVNTKYIATGLLSATLLLLNFSAAASEISVHLGLQAYEVTYETDDETIDNTKPTDNGLYGAIAFHNSIGKSGRHWLGAAIDVTELLDDTVIGFRALDYQWRFSERMHTGAFLGAASLDSGLPQNGYYFGAHAGYFILPSKLSARFELQHGEVLARDKLLTDDPGQGPENRPDTFLSYTSSSLQLAWHF